MSLFACDNCGCLENSSLSGGYHIRHDFNPDEKTGIPRNPTAAHGYRLVLGLKPDELFGAYCCVCNPVWYTDEGHYGIGPRPADYLKNPKKCRDAAGVWHDKFERIFLPKKMFATNGDGNLAHIETCSIDVDSYRLPEEEQIVFPAFIPPLQGHILPRSNDPEACNRWRDYMKKMEYEPAMGDEATRRVLLHEHIWARGRPVKKQGPEIAHVAASLMAMASMGDTGFSRIEPSQPRTKDPVKDAARIAKAEEKRRRKAEKRK